MPIKSDFHLHSSFSGDCQTPMEEMIQRGISLGLDSLCFTEHMDLDFPVMPQAPEGTFVLDTESYYRAVRSFAAAYADKLEVLFGIELGMQPCAAQRNAMLAATYPFDFIIGSCHVCEGQDPYYPAFYEGRSEEEAYRSYFACLLDNLKVFTDFDVCGHLDYVVRYGPHKDAEYTYEKYRDLLDPILVRLVESGKGLEVNTGAIAHGLKDLNPCTAVLKKYRSLGGEIVTVGSDAHRPDRLAAGFARAAEVLQSCGFTYYCTFRERKPIYHKL